MQFRNYTFMCNFWIASPFTWEKKNLIKIEICCCTTIDSQLDALSFNHIGHRLPIMFPYDALVVLLPFSNTWHFFSREGKPEIFCSLYLSQLNFPLLTDGKALLWHCWLKWGSKCKMLNSFNPKGAVQFSAVQCVQVSKYPLNFLSLFATDRIRFGKVLKQQEFDCRDKLTGQFRVKQLHGLWGTAVAFPSTDSLIVDLQLGERFLICPLLGFLCHWSLRW